MPVATYRVQLNKEFDFNKLRATLPYLSQLGISHVYASPIFRARSASLHGYDVTDPRRINEELGGETAFKAVIKEASTLGLEWIQDIVPNHIAYSTESPIVSDEMLRGTDSKYHDFLDVDWNHPSPKLNGKILAPFLRDEYNSSLRKGEIRLAYKDGFQIRYGELEFPVKFNSYRKILSKASLKMMDAIENDQNLFYKLRRYYESNEQLRTALKEDLYRFNTNAELLDELLSEQVYTLANWKAAFTQINYRRFFDQTDLICLRAEEKEVFDTTHELVKQLLEKDKIAGLRIDHVDGLCDPEQYIKRLREFEPDAYIVVEKVLIDNEILPSSWSVQGNTGYDFLNKLNLSFVASQNEAEMNATYTKFTRRNDSFGERLLKCKKQVIRELFAGDVDNLTRTLVQVLKRNAYAENCSAHNVREALVELLAAFPVYRTYLSEARRTEKDVEYFNYALESAKQRNRKVHAELAAIGRLLEESPSSQEALQFFMRLQQFTGPVMAKGFEDTALYVYNRLLSLNEVGGNPGKFGCTTRQFHEFLYSRQVDWPMSLNATSTHDTKRGEDFRARINVFSEIPSELGFQITKWSRLNRNNKTMIKGKRAPSKNEEYYFYQTLLGCFPFELADVPDLVNRLKLHVVKATREAKINSSWLSPNQHYEEAVNSFVTRLFEKDGDNIFLREFLPFQRKIAFYGFLNSISQTLIKIASPGVPDFYQGTELWDLNMVDPDNRRSVDFRKRQELLAEVQDSKPKVRALLKNFEDGRVKLYEIHKGLKTRNKNKELFQEGAYIPLNTKGALKDNVIAFCRKKGKSYAIIVAPRFLVGVTDMPHMPLGGVWKDTVVCLPKSSPKVWHEVFAERTIISRNFNAEEGLGVAELLNDFSVALLLSEESEK